MGFFYPSNLSEYLAINDIQSIPKGKNIFLYYKNRSYTVFINQIVIPDSYIKYIDIYHFYNEAGNIRILF